MDKPTLPPNPVRPEPVEGHAPASTSSARTGSAFLDPVVSPEAEGFWAAASEGRLVVRTCNACGRPHHYPRAICPHCRSTDLRWEPSDGRGTIYSYTVVTVPKGTPYVLAYVEIAPGVRAMTHIVDCDPGTLAIGQAVRAVFPPAPGGQKVLAFTPA